MNKKIYKNCKVNGALTDIEIIDGKFSAIKPLDEDGIDLGGMDVFPGLVDIHIHGANGYSVYGVPDEVLVSNTNNVSTYLAKNGITSWCPTTCCPAEKLEHFLSLDFSSFKGANVLGLHLEGPYLSKNKAGAINPANMRSPKIDDIKSFDKIKLVTVAPEIDGAMEFIKEISKKVKISLGHTTADYDTAIKAIEAGADLLNHTFNAMSPINHREPGVIPAAMDMGIYGEVISDGVHLHPAIVRMLYRAFGKERMIMISDNVDGAGLPDGEITVDGKLRLIKNNVIRNAAGNLAGSWCNLFEDVRRTIGFGIPREDVYYMASRTPAEYLGVNKGRIEVGYDADFIVVTPDDKLIKTVIGGKIFED